MRVMRVLRWLGRRIVDFAQGGRPQEVLAALVLASSLVSGCGAGRTRDGEGAAGTSIAAALIAFVAPRDGADVEIGGQLASFAQTVQTKLLDDCLTSDGFPAPTLPSGGPATDLGNPQFPNLPTIEATQNLGLFTNSATFVDPERGMSPAEGQAWQARMNHCFGVVQQRTPLFGSAKFQQLSSGWFNVVNRVAGSAQIRVLSRKAARCSAARGIPASSVTSLYSRLQGQVGAISSPGADSAKVQALQAKGASVLAACWTRVINETTALLSARQAVFLAQNANALAALEGQVNGQVSSLERQYGIKLTLVGL